MKLNQILIIIALTAAVFSMTSCTMSKDELKRIVRKEAGKDDFRDSEKWGKVVTKNLLLDDFTHISLMGNADVKFKQGETLSVEAYGNEKAIDETEIIVKDGTLMVSKKEGSDQKKVPSIKLTITAPTLQSIHVSGAGDIEMKNEVELDNDLNIAIAGAGDVSIGNLKCQSFSISISGAGDIEAQKIKCDNADISISGAGDMKADVKADDITVAISGAGDADLDVKCQNLHVTAGGTGEIELKGECTHLTKQTGGMASIDSRKLAIHQDVKIQ